MRVVYSDRHRLHDAEHDLTEGIPRPQPDRPERAERILEALVEDGSFSIQSPDEHGSGPIEAVHAPGLIRFLREGWRVWREATAAPEILPDTVVHPGLREGMGGNAPEPRVPIGRVGYWCFDTGTPIVAGTYSAALSAVDVALSAADLVLRGESVAYGLCRPPGHHAAHAVFGGFCFFNNAAITAEYLARRTDSKVAVLDVDYHHGNGTQQIFYQRGDVLYVSVHADPTYAFPFYTGYADETGVGPGRGTTLNIPLPLGTNDARYLSALDVALEAIVRFAPVVTVVSLGVDTYARDPLGEFALSASAYTESARRVAAVAPRLVIVQEGGYYLPQLGQNVRRWLLAAR